VPAAVRWLIRAALASIVTLAVACSSGGAAVEGHGDRKDAVPVAVAPVVKRDAPVELRAIGNVEAYSTVSVRSQVEGQLARVNFTEGQEVHRGDLLFEIDPRPFEAALRQAEANLARDRAQAENAAVAAGRMESLRSTGVVSLDGYDQARTQAKALEASVAADQAAVERARIDLERCSIRSPLDGRIGRLLVHEGNIVKANDTELAVINQLRPVHVEFSVPQQALPEIRRHQVAEPLQVRAFVPGDEAHATTGTLSFINNAVDTSTGTVLLKGVFANQDEALWPGQFVNVALQLTVRADAVMVPARAVQTGQEGRFVFVLNHDGTVASRPVVVGDAVGGDMIVEQGLEPGEQVVTDGQLRLAPGVRVDVKGSG